MPPPNFATTLGRQIKADVARAESAVPSSSTEPVKPNLLIIDDHPIVQIALSGQLRHALRPFIVATRTASSADEALEMLRQSTARWYVTLDLFMPGLSGIPAVKAVASLPNVDGVVVVTSLEDPEWKAQAVAAGAATCISKGAAPSELIAALTSLIHPSSDPDEARGFAPRLTPRQLEVLQCLSEGLPNKLIAKHLAISDMTVKIHVTQILRSLGASNRMKAVILAEKFGLLR